MNSFFRTCYKWLKKSEKYWGTWIAKVLGKYLQAVRIPNQEIKGRALLIYITHPFKNKSKLVHTNIQEAATIADVLADLGFVVDVLDYNSRWHINTTQYNLVLGFGDPFEKLFYEKSPAIKIHYATGAPQWLSCLAEVERIHNFFQRHQYQVVPRRGPDRTWPCSTLLSDSIISVTDGWANKEFKKFNPNVFSVPVTALSHVNHDNCYLENKQKNHFVWFGSSGAIHKGLDLCLDVVNTRNDVVLHVCGNVTQEIDFFTFYKKLLLEHPNIKYYGFVDVNSQTMLELMRTVSFAILPSCSEGCATSVLTCMAWGCIPVVTEQSGITFHGSIRIKGNTVEAISETIDQCLRMADSQRLAIMQECIDWILKNHNLTTYKITLTSILQQIISSK